MPKPFAIRQRDLTDLSIEERERELTEFEGRLRDWAARMNADGGSAPGTVSVEIPVFKGGWIMPCIESVLHQSSTDWTLSLRWDSGDELSRLILEVLQRLEHPKFRVYFGENRGIAYNRRFLTEQSLGEYILPLDDDDMLTPDAVQTFLAFARGRPWAGIVRAKREFIDEVGNPVHIDPWFPFENRHYQFGMVTDPLNHSQPAMFSRAAYLQTAGWDGFEEFRFAGEDCDLFLKVEEVASIELLPEVLYHYRLSQRRTSLVITDEAAFEMWRRLADRTIARIGLPLKRLNDGPIFRYERLPRPHLRTDMVDFVVSDLPSRPDADEVASALRSRGIAGDAIHVVTDSSGAARRNGGFRKTTRPIVCFLTSGIELTEPDLFDRLLDLMHERDADMVSPKLLSPSHTIEWADPCFSGTGQPTSRGGGQQDAGQCDFVAKASWLPSTFLITRREVWNAVGGFDERYADDVVADADFVLKARRRDFTCLYAGTVSVVCHDHHAGRDGALDVTAFSLKWSGLVSTVSDTPPAERREEPGPDPRTPAELCQSGNDLLAKQDVAAALVAFQRAVDVAPDFSWSHHGMGDALFQAARWEDAAAAYRRALELNPTVGWTHHHLGNSLARLERWDEAAESYLRATGLDPEIASGHRNLGYALARRERFADAASALERACALETTDFWTYNNLGDVLSKLERWADAIDAYRGAIALKAELPWSHMHLGTALAKLEQWLGAEAAYRQALDRAADLFVARRGLGQSLLRLERFEEAVQALQHAVALNPDDFAAHHMLGDALSKLERWQDAVPAYQQALRLNPDLSWSHAYLGRALLELERWEEATLACQRAIDLDPSQPPAREHLTCALLKCSRWEEAAGAYQAFVALQSDISRSHHRSGPLSKSLRLWEIAAAACQSAAQSDRELSWVHHNLGNTRIHLKRWEDAAAAYREAIALKPDAFWSHHNLGDALYQMHEWQDAASAYQRAVDLDPSQALAHHHLGETLLHLHRYDEAAACHRRAEALNPAWSRTEPGGPVERMERWVADLSASAADRGAHARLLFVLDNDYGELTTVMYLLLGQKLAGESTLLLPPRLFVNNPDILPGRTKPYDSLDGIVAAVDAARPDVVLLCSGHLLSHQKILSVAAVERLGLALRDRGVTIVTTDPFLGLLAHLDRSDILSIAIPDNAAEDVKRFKAEQDEQLFDALSRSFRIFEHVPHLYPAYPGAPGDEPSPRQISFFNPRLLAPSSIEKSDDEPVWLFVLSSIDYQVQTILHGKPRFLSILLRKIAETRRAGRRPVLVAPYDCVQALVERLDETSGATLLTFCPFTRFTAWLMHAECAFYWNAVSHSILLRLINALPVFLFDRGHLAHTLRPMYERTVRWYYQGSEPIYLDQKHELDATALAALSREHQPIAGDLSRNLQRSPAPERMVADLVASTRAAAGRI